jgi:hypothetical protein
MQALLHRWRASAGLAGEAGFRGEPLMQEFLQSILGPYWEFWISNAVSALGVFFSVKAFREAGKAKDAATAAAKTVKLQTVTSELSEALHKLEGLTTTIKWEAARFLVTSVKQRLNATLHRPPHGTFAEIPRRRAGSLARLRP